MARILIVDDSIISRKILREELIRSGYEIAGEASNGEEGVIMYKELKPDVVTMDITMPVMNGLEALTCIKRDDHNAKVIMVTAAGQKEKMVQAIKEGADDFITKPFEVERVLASIKHVLNTNWVKK